MAEWQSGREFSVHGLVPRLEGDAQRIIEYAHVAVHDDKFAVASDVVADLDILTPREYALIGPAGLELHMVFSVIASAPVTVEIITGATVTDNGTEVLHFRPNLWSNKDIKTTYHTPTYTGGTVVFRTRTGGTTGANANQHAGGESRDGQEIIIPSGVALIMKMTATANDTVMSVIAEYYEVPDGLTDYSS